MGLKSGFYSLLPRLTQRIFNPVEQSAYAFDYRISDKLLRVFTFGWLVWLVWKYQELQRRPAFLAEPKMWLQQLVMPALPEPFLFYSVVVLATCLTAITLWRHYSALRLILWLVLLYLSAVPWLYNALSHTGHLFVLCHFLGIFLHPGGNRDESDIARGAHWYHFGLLATYSLAGLWKFIGLLYRAFFTLDKPSWLSEDAVKANGLFNYRVFDQEMPDWLFRFFSIPWLWQVLMLFVIAIQLFAVLGALNKRLSYFFASGLIAFHLFNILFYQTFFLAAPILLAIVFFPYSVCMKRSGL